jgi:hypothetical protein
MFFLPSLHKTEVLIKEKYVSSTLAIPKERHVNTYVTRHESYQLKMTTHHVLLLIKSQIRWLESNANIGFWGEIYMDSVFLWFEFMLLGKYFQSSRMFQDFTILQNVRKHPTKQRQAPEETNSQQRHYESLQSCTAIYKCWELVRDNSKDLDLRITIPSKIA